MKVNNVSSVNFTAKPPQSKKVAGASVQHYARLCDKKGVVPDLGLAGVFRSFDEGLARIKGGVQARVESAIATLEKSSAGK